MRRLSVVAAVAAFSIVSIHLVTDRASAQGTSSPSAKATVKLANLNVVSGPQTSGESAGSWQTILASTIKTSSQKDLVCSASLECGLYTMTQVKSKMGTSDTSMAKAGIEVQVLVDGRPAHPGPVVFARRTQELSATLQGIITNAIFIDPVTGTVTIDETLVTPEEISLLLETMNAASFDFVLQDVGTGVHRVEVQARLNLGAASQAGSAAAKATIGKGCLSVEEVRLVKGSDIGF